ncbi:MAG: AmmeMemoRadiSam system protein A [Planctomycetes bacterium]|nr:AmmeMemoRadiSam system protein A [Planctomycetota bacterium]
MTETQTTLNSAEGREALNLARRSLEHFVRTGKRLKLEAKPTGGLQLPCGAFVSLHTLDGALRGCIGHMIGDGPLYELLIELGVSAGTRDPRFAPVTAAELDDLVYEISVLSPMRAATADAVIPGVHGLYIRRGQISGVLLPQVAVEWKWDREAFLEQTCHKAGLPGDAWRDPDTQIMTFTAQVFRE